MNDNVIAFSVEKIAVTKKRGYSAEFPTTRDKRVYYMIDKIPPALWIRVKAKAKREGVSIRTLILGWCEAWVKGEPIEGEGKGE